MATCLIALGSNLGDRAATLNSAAAAIGAVPGVQLLRRSRWYPTRPIGGDEPQQEYLNGAALLETAREPEDLHDVLQQIEIEHGRQRRERWADRTLDLDLLLYDQQIIDAPTLTVPHPRMSFRPFVLEPATEVAGQMVHPTIGWTLKHLLDHLGAGADCLAIVSPLEPTRRDLAAMLADRCIAANVDPPIVNDDRWPALQTAWLAVPAGIREPIRDTNVYPEAHLPKLTILLDPPTASDAAWTAFVQRIDRGPTLRIPAMSANVVQEALAAIEAVWPHLCPLSPKRLQ